MTINRLLAQMTVSDVNRAVDWYGRLFGREPDARPMEGLVEWHLADTFGVQVWLDPERAGHSAVVLDESDLDGRAAELDAAGLPYEGPQEVTASRIVQLVDPDGNQVVITGA
jgi:catechol 2,3-dioxygenase-like lactoylglutathione lyase family enzyme